MSKSVAAVVVTYNRSRLLLECLDSLLRQTRPIDGIVLIDNASGDGTPELLESRGYLRNPKIAYTRLPTNTGGAGGFHEGLKRAFEAGFDWLWIMDDDAEPSDDALALMAPLLDRNDIAGIANLPVDPDGKPQSMHRGWLEIGGTTLNAHRAIDPATLSSQVEVDFASFVGLAVPRAAVEKIGLPMREMFIKCDDLEYCMRLRALGPIILLRDSRIVHKDGAGAAMATQTRFGRHSNRVPLDKLWLSYFLVRNLVWLRRRDCGMWVAAVFAARTYLRNAVGILLYDSDRRVRLAFFWHAIVDAWYGVFDNDKPKRLTRS